MASVERSPTRWSPVHAARQKGIGISGQRGQSVKSFLVGTEHFLLGLLREGEGIAARVWKLIPHERDLKF